MARQSQRNPTEENSRSWECISPEMAAVMREKTGVERLAIADGMWRSAWKMIYLNFKEQNPDWSEERCRRETANRMSHGAV